MSLAVVTGRPIDWYPTCLQHLRKIKWRCTPPEFNPSWQHVLEPLAGYLILAEKLCRDSSYSCPWNFGPGEEACLPAAEIANQLASQWGENAAWHAATTDFPHEAVTLQLDSSLARKRLGWYARWSLPAALSATIFWHKSWLTATDMRGYTLKQIAQYSANEYPQQ